MAETQKFVAFLDGTIEWSGVRYGPGEAVEIPPGLALHLQRTRGFLKRPEGYTVGRPPRRNDIPQNAVEDSRAESSYAAVMGQSDEINTPLPDGFPGSLHLKLAGHATVGAVRNAFENNSIQSIDGIEETTIAEIAQALGIEQPDASANERRGPLPDDFPHRAILTKYGIETWEKLIQAEELKTLDHIPTSEFPDEAWSEVLAMIKPEETEREPEPKGKPKPEK